MTTSVTETKIATNNDNTDDNEYINIRLLRNSDAMDAFKVFPFHYDESCSSTLVKKNEMMITTLMESYAHTRLEILELFTEEELKFFVYMFQDYIDTRYYGLNWFLTEIKNACKYDQLDKLLSLDTELLIEKVSKLSYFKSLCLRLLAISYWKEPNFEIRLTYNQNNLEDVKKFNQIFGYSDYFKNFVKYYIEIEF